MLARTDSALRLLEEAIAIAPDAHSIHLAYVRLRWEDGDYRAVAAEYRERRGGDPDLRRCLQALTDFSAPIGYASGELERAFQRLHALRDAPAARACVISTRAFLGVRGANPLVAADSLVALVDSAREVAPQAYVHWIDALNLQVRMQRDRVRPTCASATRAIVDPVDRFRIQVHCASVLFTVGDTSEALSRYRALAAAVRRDRRPVMRMQFLREADLALQLFAGASQTEESLLREIVALAEDAGDWRRAFFHRWSLGRLLIDQGQPSRALVELDAALAIANARDLPRFRLRALTSRGRALTRAGRSEEGIENLRQALRAGNGGDDVYGLAEAWHNLAHAYERLGRLAQAAAAIDLFVAISTPFRWDGLRVISLRDAGEIKRKAGWRAAANADYERMVSVVREQGNNHQWAGEYFERRGLLREAAEMYQAGIRRSPVDPLDLAGLARVFTALGRLDSAAVMADAHDAARRDWRPGDVPLLPDVLARQGRLAEATTILRDWAATRARAGEVHGAALAHLAWGRMALRSGALVEAARATVAAESLARRAAAPAEVIGARALGLRVMALREGPDPAIAKGRLTLDEAALREQPGLRFEVATALGDVAMAAGRADDALAAYLVAAQAVDTLSAALSADLDRASFRDRHLAPFDSALALLAREPVLRAPLLLDWSGRRKAAALRLSGEATRAMPSVTALHGRLEPGTLFLDFVLVNDRVLVLAMTQETLAAHRVDAISAAIVADVARARRGLDDVWMGQVDLARVRTDSAALRRLTRALLQPVAPALGQARRLLIATDGALAALPFEMLPDPNDPAQPVLLATSVGYVPGAWAAGPARAHRARTVLVVEQDAPGAIRERDAVRAAWRFARVAGLRDSAATEDALRAWPGAPDILHVIAHAVNDPTDPSASHLRLAAGASHDGYLHTTEISALRGAPSLVILSACATATGASFAGEGAFSLSRAFLRAGADDVVATHWPIGDAAGRLSEVLHQRLRDGAKTIDALTDARRALYADPATRHPFYWASFVLLSTR